MTTTAPEAAVDPDPSWRASVRSRLVPPMPGPAWAGWVGAVALALFAGALRLIGLGRPAGIYFDETYYAKNALSMWIYGYEHETLENADAMLARGNGEIWSGGADFVVHPPLAKWLIAAGDQLWRLLPGTAGVEPEGWRLASALFGALSVLLLVRIAHRLTRSWLLGCAAGLIMALDGLHFTLSRIAMVDMFVTFFILAGFGCLVIDRDSTRTRLARNAERGADAVNWLGMRWWRIAAGACLGLAAGCKWSALFYLAAFGLLTVAWDYGARRSSGHNRTALRWFGFDAVPAFVQMVGVALVSYVATWTGWLATSGGYGRGWGAANMPGWLQGAPGFVQDPVNALRSLVYYHQQMYSFHSGLSKPHDYASQPWEWPIMRTPVAFYYDDQPATCGASDCSTTVLSIGTPAVWWLGIVAVVVMLAWWLLYRDWRAGAVLLGVAAGWLPWFAYPDRTMFVFYALPMLPFVVLAIVLALGLAMGAGETRPEYSPLARVAGGVVFGVVLLLVVANFTYLYPVLSAQTIPYEDWANRMWFQTWIYGNGGGS